MYCPIMGTNLVIIVRPFKTQLSLCSLISQSSMGSIWVAKVPTFFGWKTKIQTDQTEGMQTIAD